MPDLTRGLTLPKLPAMRLATSSHGFSLRMLGLGLLLGAGACSGSVSCNSCAGTALAPIPGGFDPAARIEKAAQIRLSQTGLTFLETRFSDLVNAYARQTCGAPEDVPCAQAFSTSCDMASGVCVDGAGVAQPVLGFEIEYDLQGAAEVCRDDVNDPARRDCYAWLRLEGLALTPEGPDRVRANINARLVTTVIPIQYTTRILDLDCIVTLDSSTAGSPLQDIEMVLELGAWVPPSGTTGGQFQINVLEVNAVIPDEDLIVAGDPVHGSAGDAIACGGLNAIGSLKAALISQLTDELGSIIGTQLDEASGWTCGAPTDRTCPTGTSCNADNFCEYAGRIVPAELGLEGRADFASLLGGLGGGRPGETDIAFLIGGQSSADPAGLSVAALGGAELVTLDPTCAQDLPSPRVRPGFSTPPALPTDGQVDLDFDGSPETDYMVAAGISQSFLDQVMWSLYGSGVFCQRISADDVGLLNTGSLGLLVPSLGQLTHSDLYPWSVFPVSMTLTPTKEPFIEIGTGEVLTSGGTPDLVDPLVKIVLDDVRLDFTAQIEERWVHLMTIQADIALGLGATVNPANEIELVIGDLSQAVTDVQVFNADLLAETPQELADAIPALIQLALPQITGALPSIPLPGPEGLGGFDLQVLGVRGVQSTTSTSYPNLAIYADLDFVPGLAGNLQVAAQTSARVADIQMPGLAEMTAKGGALATTITIEVGHDGTPALEHQVRIDGGLWSPFSEGSPLVLSRKSFSVPGAHQIEIRARVIGDYRSLDATPVVLTVVVDPEPPHLDVRRLADGEGLRVRSLDRVSRERVTLTLLVDGQARLIQPDADGRVDVPELTGPSALTVRSEDEQGNRAETVVRSAGQMRVPTVTELASGGCRCAAPAQSGPSPLWLAGFFVLWLGRRNHRSCH